jgi:hypothetical protein
MSRPLGINSQYLLQPYTRLFMHLRIYTLEISCYNHQRKKADIAMTITTIEEKYLKHINGLLPFFSRQLNAYRLQCPYCQLGSKDHKGRPMTSGRCKGFFYSNGNALNYKCHRCGTGKQFHTFLEDHFPSVFLEYVAERDGLGLTGKGTNAPTLSNAAQRVSGRVTGASGDEVVESDSGMKETGCKDAGDGTESNQNQLNSRPTAPAITKLPRLTPQQQAGCSARLAHKVKQHQQRRQRDPAARYLQD